MTQFIAALMEHVMEGVNIPKVQIERVVGPIIGFFIAEVLTETFKNHPELSGEYLVLSPEFPLLKGDENKQSTNIDWLMYNKTKKELVFLELKTTDTTFDAAQAQIYISLMKKIEEEGGEGSKFLIENIENIQRHSGESGKYGYILKQLEEKLPDCRNIFAECRAAQVVYLAPQVAHKAEFSTDIHWLSFGELAPTLPQNSFGDEWTIILDYLKKLDGCNRKSRNGEIAEELGLNYGGKDNFDAIIQHSKLTGKSIVIGFNGGESALNASDLNYLQNRSYKWDLAENGQGKKVGRNWISGEQFLEIIQRKQSQ